MQKIDLLANEYSIRWRLGLWEFFVVMNEVTQIQNNYTNVGCGFEVVIRHQQNKILNVMIVYKVLIPLEVPPYVVDFYLSKLIHLLLTQSGNPHNGYKGFCNYWCTIINT